MGEYLPTVIQTDLCYIVTTNSLNLRKTSGSGLLVGLDRVILYDHYPRGTTCNLWSTSQRGFVV